jgi:RNA recognition motif-containing protein
LVLIHFRCRYAFVEFANERSVSYACRVTNGLRFFDRPLRVNPSSGGRDTGVVCAIKLAYCALSIRFCGHCSVVHSNESFIVLMGPCCACCDEATLVFIFTQSQHECVLILAPVTWSHVLSAVFVGGRLTYANGETTYG